MRYPFMKKIAADLDRLADTATKINAQYEGDIPDEIYNALAFIMKAQEAADAALYYDAHGEYDPE